MHNRYKVFPVGRILLFLILILNVILIRVLLHAGSVSFLTASDCEKEKFRCLDCGELMVEQLERLSKPNQIKCLTTSMMMADYKQPKKLLFQNAQLLRYRGNAYECMEKAYASIWWDVSCFPLRDLHSSYENSWMKPRTYGGERNHEGCDLFPRCKASGYEPVQSMTDGKVEKIGWLSLGGYRIGIRAFHGGYFYYAHLDSYQQQFQVGDSVYAGEILGYAGNSGYGIQGTKGKFPVHLHLGIYIQTKHYTELSVNPYWVLRYIHKKSMK